MRKGIANHQESVTIDPSEIGPLAKMLAHSYEGYIRFLEDAYNISRAQAKQRAKVGMKLLSKYADDPPDQISWISLAQISEKDSDKAIAVWAAIRQEARDELQSGHRAAAVVSHGFDFGPLDRARFLEVRATLYAEWQPTCGSESLMVDQLAQFHAAVEFWLSQHMMQVVIGNGDRNVKQEKRDGSGWVPERLSEADSVQLSAAMVDKFHKMFIRTLRSLRDLRRLAPQIVVQNAGQVNVGQQQVNVQQGD